MRNLTTLHFIKITLLILLYHSFLVTQTQAEEYKSDFIVVINSQDKDQDLSKQQIRNIFMGGALSNKYKAINLPSGNQLRIEFNTKIVGLTESRIQAYWAQMKFTGRSKPPMELNSPQETLKYLEKTEGAIAYLPPDILIPDNLTVIYP
ncbi:hypothetical protein AB6T38_17945 [Aliiglaciecola sp. SL4]|uniref:hypothetical protein n=1 Tax=Aliiglaciecola sp. SL4 TaxID=3239806 RepID=UPI00355B88E6